MLNCEQASQLASREMDEKLPLRQRLALKFHLLLCRSCSNFTRQLNFLREAARQSKNLIALQLSDKAKQRIIQTLKENIHRDPPGS